MTCDQCRIAISARLDGEDPGLSSSAVDDHLAGCAFCRAYLDEAARLHRAVRLVPAEPIPDLTAGILRALGERGMRPAARDAGLRLCLAVVGVLQIAGAVPALVLGDDAGLPVHTARHLGSFAVALGVGFVFAAWRPARIPGLLPVAAALVVCLAGTSAIDVTSGHAAALGEVPHVTELVGLAIAWLLVHPVMSSRPQGVRS